MAFETVFTTIDQDALTDLVTDLHEQGHRFVQILAVATEDGCDLVYSFMKDEVLTNYEIKAVKKTDAIPSITEYFLEAFVFENEIHDLFGIQIDDIEIDFGGHFYRTAIDEPMTIISPERAAQREKARKAARAAEKKKAAANESQAAADRDEADAEFERKLAAMPPEKAAKVRAAMEAKRAKEQKKAQDEADAEFERKLAAMPPEKAAKVRAAMEAKRAKQAKEKGERS